MELPAGFDHPAWMSAVGTVVSYGIILTVMFALLFLVPYLFFLAL